MEGTDSERFDVYFRGECIDGAGEEDVRAALGRLFRADEATLDRLFGGELQRIKRGVDRPTAEKYRRAMEAAGARPLIHAQGDAPPAEGARVNAGGTQAPEESPGPGPGPDFDLAPVGSDVLRPEERAGHKASPPATDHFDLAPVGENLGTETHEVPPLTAPDFDLADLGEDLGEDLGKNLGEQLGEDPGENLSADPDSGAGTALEPARHATAEPPDTRTITLSAPDHDLTDCAAPAPDSPAPATDHLSVALPGSDLISRDERMVSPAQAPSTDHLSLETPDGAAADDAGADSRQSPGNIFDRP